MSSGYSPSGTCFGDDGAPLFVYDTDGFPLALGVVSSADQNCSLVDFSQRADKMLAFFGQSLIVCTQGQSCEGIFRAPFENAL